MILQISEWREKKILSEKDEKDWLTFTKQSGKVYDKEKDQELENKNLYKIYKLDLHGFSLEDANAKTKKFILESFNQGYKKLLIVTGKGLRSKINNDPYRSKKMNVLKHSDATKYGTRGAFGVIEIITAQ